MDLSQVVSQDRQRSFEVSAGFNEVETEEIERKTEEIYFELVTMLFDFPAPILKIWLRRKLEEDMSTFFEEKGELVVPTKICSLCRQIVSLFAFKMNIATHWRCCRIHAMAQRRSDENLRWDRNSSIAISLMHSKETKIGSMGFNFSDSQRWPSRYRQLTSRHFLQCSSNSWCKYAVNPSKQPLLNGLIETLFT